MPSMRSPTVEITGRNPMSRKLSPLNMSIDVGSDKASPNKGSLASPGRIISDYMAHNNAQIKANHSRRNEAMSRSMAVPSDRTSTKSAPFEVIGA